MTQERLEKILGRVGCPVTENCFERAQRLPYIAYMQGDSSNMFADNSVYLGADTWRVELYVRRADRKTERALEQIFDEEGICWEKTREYSPEGCIEVLYEFEEMRDNENGSSNTAESGKNSVRA